MSARTYQLVLRRRVPAAEGGMGRADMDRSDSTHLVDLGKGRGELCRDVHGDRSAVTGDWLAKLQQSMRQDKRFEER